jgi:hypothetical protein
MTGPYPRISIVTPSLNQARYLEATIRSVLDQNYPNLDYVVIDGGSTDGSVNIIRRYAGRLSYWVSEPDAGQYAAIDKGFAHTTGDIMAWLNADDMYLPWTLDTVAKAFLSDASVDWLTTAFPMKWDMGGAPVSCGVYTFTSRGILRGECLPAAPWHGQGWLQQESTFWSRRLWIQTGARLATQLSYAGDFELWTRFALHTELRTVRLPLAGFRLHERQKTHDGFALYRQEADQVLRLLGVRPSRTKNALRAVARGLRGCGALIRKWAGTYGLVKPPPAPVILNSHIVKRPMRYQHSM